MTRILIVEDNPGDARLLKEIIADSILGKVDILFAERLSEAIGCVRKSDLDIAILDLTLPDASGEETLRHMMDAAPDLPIVILTGTNDDALGLRLVQEGAQDFLVKGSVDGELLARSIRYAIQRKRIEFELMRKNKDIQEAHNKLRATTEMLIQAEKMNAVGTLVAGVAHELNNPLMGIVNILESSLTKMDRSNGSYEHLLLAREATERCIEIVRELLTFSRLDKKNEESFRKESCLKVLERVFKLVDYRIKGSGIIIIQNINGEDYEVWMNPNNIQQVFLNLISNAIDALEKSETKEIRVIADKNDTHVEISIEDTAGGISPEDLNKIFDAFYTTKPAGKGTGLGLSISRNIINDHRGEITCHSESGVGTKFRVLLPIDRRVQ